MHVNYLIESEGDAFAVLISIKDWEKIKKKLEPVDKPEFPDLVEILRKVQMKQFKELQNAPIEEMIKKLPKRLLR